jgi:hypothetical protein
MWRFEKGAFNGCMKFLHFGIKIANPGQVQLLYNEVYAASFDPYARIWPIQFHSAENAEYTHYCYTCFGVPFYV